MDYEIRSLSTPEEFREHERLQREVWGSETIDVPTNLLAAGARHGSVVLGAYDGREMIGILYGFPALTEGLLHHHSHMTGVLPEYRRRGIALALKLRQRELVLAQGLNLVTWTVDPLEVSNNLFNFGRLGVVCNTYLVNAYGEMDDALNRGLPSDRLEVHWRLDSELPPKRPSPPDGTAALSALPGPSGLPEPQVSDVTWEGTVLIQAPLHYRRIKEMNPQLALDWRLRLREALTRMLSEGYSIVGCYSVGDVGMYELRRDEAPP